MNEPARLQLGWTRGLSLTARILAVNLFMLAVLAGGLFFLDSYRSRLIDESRLAAQTQASTLADLLGSVDKERQQGVILRFARQHSSRIRLYGQDGEKLLDSFDLAKPTYILRDPATEPWQKRAARLLDSSFDFLVMAPTLPAYAEPARDIASAWPEITAIAESGETARVSIAPDVTHMVSAAARIPDGKEMVLSTSNDRDIRLFVRAERTKIGLFFLAGLVIAVLLSLFLARTIALPIRHLAKAAVKVRLGRAREVMVPRLPSRRDEIGMLARALSDMSIALRQRIDATEAFAADVAHEIKNPLASLRSALDGMENVKDEKLRKQLMGVAKNDVQRMDRLISDISEASRVDAQLAKAKFEPIDVGDMIEQLLVARENRVQLKDVKIAFARPRKGVAMVMGEDIRLERVLNNLIDNAISFSPDGGLVEISATSADNRILIRVTDEGRGVPSSEREAIFKRFHSERPSGEGFGQHSGLGLAIARTIIEGHQGEITVCDREDGRSGACFQISLPDAESQFG